MNKRFSVCILLIALLCLGSLSLGALAEIPAFPINTPPAFGEVPTQFPLFSGQPVEYEITLQVNEETGLRTYTIANPLAWGLDASVPGVWEYADDGGWQRTGDAAGEQVQLLLSGAVYEEMGFPLWGVPCSVSDTSLELRVYLGELRRLYAYVDYVFAGSSIGIMAEDLSFVVNCGQYDEEEDGFRNLYASYDPAGVLVYAAHSFMSADSSQITYTVNADVSSQSYPLTDISHTDADGNSVFWNCYDNQWQTGNFEPADAPEGISPENLPFTIVGDWAGVPFEQPGDKPEGTFPAAAVTADPALAANEYRPWPEDPNALYRNWAEAGSIPALPEVTWQTQEDGDTLYTLGGVERWGIQESAMVPWTWDSTIYQWMDSAEPTPGQVTLTYPANAEIPNVFWDHFIAYPDELFMLELDRSTLTVKAGFDNAAEGFYWQMDNQGGLVYTRWLDDTRSLEAIYDNYTLIEYNIHQNDGNGNRLAQACYQPTDADPSVFELACFFLYSPEMNYEEALWLKDIGWYSYETGEPCDAPQGVDLETYPPLVLE